MIYTLHLPALWVFKQLIFLCFCDTLYTFFNHIYFFLLPFLATHIIFSYQGKIYPHYHQSYFYTYTASYNLLLLTKYMCRLLQF